MSVAMPFPPPYCDRFRGASIHARGFALAAWHESSWTPPANGTWTEHEYVPRCWTHPGYARHVVWKPEDDVVIITQLASGTPTLQPVLALGEDALGPGANPVRVASYPLSLRLPLRADGRPSVPVPPEGMHCRRVWPLAGAATDVMEIAGHDVELRLSATRHGKRSVQFYAEAFLGRAHENVDGNPRSSLYSPDARHVLMDLSRQQLRRFTSCVMDKLLQYADGAQRLGLEVDTVRRLSGRQIAKIQTLDDVDDVLFAIRVPQPGGDEKFTGSCDSP